MTRFEIGDDEFLLDGKPFRIISGALHYFRVHPAQWRDRIRSARLMGLNTIETYVPWNVHEPRPGEFTETGPDGRFDLIAFLRIVEDEGMRAIVRPGPYICAEWDGGGLPGWLLRDRTIRPRSSDPRFLEPATRYLSWVLGLVAPLQVDRGGPVILVQVENEYGAYGDDPHYLQVLTDTTRGAGITVPLTTVDQPSSTMIRDGSLPGLHKTASFGSQSRERLALLRREQPTGPLMCSEFWCGWFDDWGAHHHTTSTAAAAAELDEILSAGASVNIYMFHGGTNFGFTNGANDKGTYHPIVTSYDYDAPLDEAGRPTEKFWAFRDVIAKYADVPDAASDEPRRSPAFDAALRPGPGLLESAGAVSAWVEHAELPSMDDAGRNGGFLAYRTQLTGPDRPGVLSFDDVRDRAVVFLDGVRLGVLSRELHERALTLPRSHGELLVLVEDQGRVDYGPRIGEHKGLIGPARLDGEPLLRWQTLDVDADRLAAQVDASPAATSTSASPRFHLAEFTLDSPADLFLDSAGWGKGNAWLNGFPLGRYWQAGPQRTLYVPAGATQAGSNRLVVLEVDTLVSASARFLPAPELGQTEF
ncbi:glycoside hydrolase family 35 protein [Gryllotalpicola koreensis]|uniref:glycoside hydrolase family 35 protein n=1 Tax=Gryllotalpicola koreensis TaxID=993086 RepID=UPI0031DE5F60